MTDESTPAPEAAAEAAPAPVFLDPYDHDCGFEAFRENLRTLIAAVVIEHNTEHDGAYQWCSHPLCVIAKDVT